MDKIKNQLHQLLAVEKDLVTKGNVILGETITTFTKKADHFDGLVKNYDAFEDSADLIPSEKKEVVTTVKEKINYCKKAIIKAIDATISKEETNSSGHVRAELIVNGKSFGLLSSISLLTLEKRLIAIRGLYKTIPTLDPVRTWKLDNKDGREMYFTEPETKYRTEKKAKPLELSPATKEHPAQVQLITYDIQAGSYNTTYMSGRITPSQKSKALQRIDDLIISTKKAKALANQAEVENKEIGKEIFSFINKDIL